MEEGMQVGRSSFCRQGWIGLLLVSVCWPLNWALQGPRTAFLFFPLWLGYVLFVDGLVASRSGTSLLTRMGAKFPLLFLLSAPAWWLFELMNRRVQNWEYLGGKSLSDLQQFFLSTIAFSTVVPAVFETAELLRTTPYFERFSHGPRIPCGSRACRRLLVAGIVMIVLTMLWPRYFYPLVWGGVYLILEPFNAFLGRPTLIERAASRDWRPIVCLAAGSLVCGFFWEMWNFFSFPKWIYHVPGVGVFHIFEMPALGYIGYIPFAWELFALSYFVWPGAPRLRI